MNSPGPRAQPLLLHPGSRIAPARMQTGARQQGTAEKFPSPSAEPLEMLNKAFENRPRMELSPISQRFGEQCCCTLFQSSWCVLAALRAAGVDLVQTQADAAFLIKNMF